MYRHVTHVPAPTASATPNPTSRSLRSGFTLIELLVVIAIISVLSSILFPVFAHVREKARQTACASNIRQLGFAAVQYVMDSDETWPPDRYSTDGNGCANTQNWFGSISHSGPNLVVDKTTGLLQPYMHSALIQKCPSWTGAHIYGDGNGYGYNWTYLGSDLYKDLNFPWWAASDCGLGRPAAEASLRHPSTTVAFADAGFINAPWYGGDGQLVESSEIDPPSQWYGDPTVNFRHVDSDVTLNYTAQSVTEHGIANLMFCDGHVKAYHQNDVTDALFQRD